MISVPEPRRAVRRARLVVEAPHFGQHFRRMVRSFLTMTKNIALSRPAMSAIAAFLALSTPGAFAQEAPTITMTPPVAAPAPRSEERRVGKGGVRPCRTRGSPYP